MQNDIYSLAEAYLTVLRLCRSDSYEERLFEVEQDCLEALGMIFRYNHNHDPHTGRFTSGDSVNTVDNPGESGIIRETENQKLLKAKIQSGELPLKINPDKQARHILQNGEIFKSDGRSYLTIGLSDAQLIIDEYHATGDVVHIPSSHKFKELITANREIGVDGRTNQKTKQAFINYSKTGTHIVPTKKGRKHD